MNSSRNGQFFLIEARRFGSFQLEGVMIAEEISFTVSAVVLGFALNSAACAGTISEQQVTSMDDFGNRVTKTRIVKFDDFGNPSLAVRIVRADPFGNKMVKTIRTDGFGDRVVNTTFVSHGGGF
jgi:hypothetical protein